MAEGGPGRGRGGRGAIIAKLLELERRPGLPQASSAGVEPLGQQPPIQPPAPPAGDGPLTSLASDAPKLPVIGGRGLLMQRVQQQAAAQLGAKSPGAPPAQPSPTPQLPPPTGRGMLLQKLMSGYQAQSSSLQPPAQPAQSQSTLDRPIASTSTPESQLPDSVESDIRNITERLSHVKIDADKPPIVMRGNEGKEIYATANYIPLLMKPGRGIFEYEVRFTPPVDDRGMCDKMLFFQHRDVLGRRRTFDGVTLYVPQSLPESALTLESVHPVTNEKHSISFKFRRERSMLECTHMYNVLFNNIQKELQLVPLKPREYFSKDLSIAIPQHRLEVWPGYVTAVAAYEGGIMLNCNCSTKVLRTDTVLDKIYQITSTNSSNWKEILQREIIGQSVMTKQPPIRMYRIDDIDFTKNPTSTFTFRDGTTMDFIEYHRRKGIQITDTQQPLLIHRPKPNKRPGAVGFYNLIPEVCYLTGLTDEMRSDFKVMKDVARYTRVNPNQRIASLQKFIDNIRGSPNCVAMLDEWGLKVPDRTVDLQARVLNPEPLYFGKNFVDNGSAQADWSRSATSKHMLEVVHINNWLVVHTQRDERNAKDFIEMMGKVCPQMGVNIQRPDVEKTRDDRTDTYLRVMRETLNENVQLVVIIFPTSRDDRYAAVKKLCCVDRPIPSQVINSRTISRPEKLRSIVQKIALQINCKLGGALWAVKIPFKNAMICGIDSYHDSKARAQSVAAVVSSMNPSITRWHSQIFIQSTDREMVDGLRVAMCTALTKYYEVNSEYPANIIIYRDGVGDGQLRVCEEHEIQAIKKAFSTISLDYNPSMAFIICQKRITTRIFIPQGNDYENPPPGSIIDHTITRRYYYDFFLVSQLVRQGTVTPTHYIVLHNTTRLDPDKIQKLTYKMCHLYYNWPGTIRVPAPCQYAHKLAHLVGCSIHKEPAKILCDKLFFL